MHAPLFYREIEKIATRDGWDLRLKALAMADFMAKLFVEATANEQLVFSTFFARISYAGHKFRIQPDILRRIHHFRALSAKLRSEPAAATEALAEKAYRLGVQALAETVLVLYQTAIPPEVLALFADAGAELPPPPEIWQYKAKARVVALADDPLNFALTAVDEDNPAVEVRVLYNLPDRNESFNNTIQALKKTMGFPAHVNLLEVDIDARGDYRPRIFVLEPDYLMDVSAVADCFKENSTEPLSYLVRKFLPSETTPAILLGNIANFFLDRLMTEPQATWEVLVRETFQVFPLPFAALPDAEVKGLLEKAKKHFTTLKIMVLGGFEQEKIEPEHCFLEPAFYSELYGLQGRLDVFYQSEEGSAIVELKGGSVFRPNAYGITRSHFTQTLLYDLLVRSVYGNQTHPAKYILYSGQETQPLRFAPTVPPEQWEAIHVRNQLVSIERLLAQIQPGAPDSAILNRLQGRDTGKKDFLQRDFAIFESAYRQLTPLEKKYFLSHCGAIAREHRLSKTGEENIENINGNAALWRLNFDEKNQVFSILSHLTILENKADQAEACIIFQKTEKTNPLANFRNGDIAVLYPMADEQSNVLDAQVIKCTITEIGKTTVAVQLRYRQFNLRAFPEGASWTLEPDMLDNGYNNQYKSLFEWACSAADKKALLLGQRPPAQPAPAQPIPAAVTMGLTEEQRQVFEAAVHSSDYYLLWGPPGTGKTSVMIKALAQYWFSHSTDNILLLAYTNRAVDEICEALESISDDMAGHYLRIGSRHSTSEHFRGQLLHAKIANIRTRVELRQIIDQCRIFVGTVSSFQQNDGLLRLKKFDRLVVDESSQLLEPQLVGLLSRFKHFILVGDHKQLPAVSAQKVETSLVVDPELNALGVQDLRDSYFERLFRLATKNNWHHAVGRLSQQGRMHRDIMDFPNTHFYGGFLKTIHAEKQALDLQFQASEAIEKLCTGAGLPMEKLLHQRVIFLPTEGENAAPGQKTNREEAEKCARLIAFFQAIYKENNWPWTANSLGIITPWRAQIAQLRAAIAAAGIDAEAITIDTVERYQGGARDIILISTCVNFPSQLTSLVAPTQEGVDRKLNVALTRARQQVIMVGNAALLSEDARYRAFIQQYG